VSVEQIWRFGHGAQVKEGLPSWASRQLRLAELKGKVRHMFEKVHVLEDRSIALECRINR